MHCRCSAHIWTGNSSIRLVFYVVLQATSSNMKWHIEEVACKIQHLSFENRRVRWLGYFIPFEIVNL